MVAYVNISNESVTRPVRVIVEKLEHVRRYDAVSGVGWDDTMWVDDTVYKFGPCDDRIVLQVRPDRRIRIEEVSPL